MQVQVLFKHLRRHPRTCIDLQFWSEITDEPLLTSLSTSNSRWLSLLKPLQKLYAAHTTALAHLHYHFVHHADRETKKTVRWVFLLMASWKWKVVVAGVVDILEACFACKHQLEKDLTSVFFEGTLLVLWQHIYRGLAYEALFLGSVSDEAGW